MNQSYMEGQVRAIKEFSPQYTLVSVPTPAQSQKPETLHETVRTSQELDKLTSISYF